MRMRFERGKTISWGTGDTYRTNTGTFFPVGEGWGISSTGEEIPEEDRAQYIRVGDYHEVLLCTRSAIVKFKDNGLEPGCDECELVLTKTQPRKPQTFYEINEKGMPVGFTGQLYEGLRLYLRKAYRQGYRYGYLTT